MAPARRDKATAGPSSAGPSNGIKLTIPALRPNTRSTTEASNQAATMENLRPVPEEVVQNLDLSAVEHDAAPEAAPSGQQSRAQAPISPPPTQGPHVPDNDGTAAPQASGSQASGSQPHVDKGKGKAPRSPSPPGPADYHTLQSPPGYLHAPPRSHDSRYIFRILYMVPGDGEDEGDVVMTRRVYFDRQGRVAFRCAWEPLAERSRTMSEEPGPAEQPGPAEHGLQPSPALPDPVPAATAGYHPRQRAPATPSLAPRSQPPHMAVSPDPVSGHRSALGNPVRGAHPLHEGNVHPLFQHFDAEVNYNQRRRRYSEAFSPEAVSPHGRRGGLPEAYSGSRVVDRRGSFSANSGSMPWQDDLLIPHSIISNLENNWRAVIPLGAFTRESLMAATAGARPNHGDYYVRVPTEDLGRDEFFDAIHNLAFSIRQFYRPSIHAPALAEMFENMWIRLSRRPDWGTNFPVYRSYIIAATTQFVLYPSRDIRVDNFNSTLYTDILLARLRGQGWNTNTPADASSSTSSSSASSSQGSRKSFRVKSATNTPAAAKFCTLCASTSHNWKGHPMENNSVSTSTVPRAALEVPRAITRTSVVFAGPLSTVPNTTANESELLPIVTRFNHEAWSAMLAAAGCLAEFADIPHGIQFGFSCGLSTYRLTSTFIPPNHFFLPHHREHVLSKLQEEISLGRISKGYPPKTLETLIGPFRTSPLSVSETRPGKLRTIVNHSFPFSVKHLCDTSLMSPGSILLDPHINSPNSVIDSKKFQCAWGTFSQCYLMIADSPANTQVAIFDVDAAFRNIPVLPAERCFLAIMVDGLVHIDHAMNFGATPAPGIWGRIADAMVRLLRHAGVQDVIKWVDDFAFFRYPTGKTTNGKPIYPYDESLVWQVANQLGWPWAPAKFVPFSRAFTYIGFEWNLDTLRVSLTRPKREKYQCKLTCWLAEETHSLAEAENLIGTLNHVTLVVPDGKVRLVHLCSFRATFKNTSNNRIRHRISTALRTDLEWWYDRLSQEDVSIPIVRPSPPRSDISLFVDASTCWGIGLVLNGKWLAWELKDGWKSDGREIGWAEMVAVELAIRTLIAGGLRDAHIICHSDNTGVVGALKAGTSRGIQQNAILREILVLFQKYGIWLTPKWIPSEENPADGPSRGRFAAKENIYGYHPSIPSHLTQWINLAITSHNCHSA